jgi:hypothetical protein
MPTKPNSLFLFTAKYYTLEEAMRFAKLINLCNTNRLNIAVSVLDFRNGQYPAIRIKNLPDYILIHKLQECFMEQGVEFAKNVNIGKTAIIKTKKCFNLEKLDENIFIDHLQEKTGYIALSKLIDNKKFSRVIADVRNNSQCPMFDAAMGAIILDSEITDIIRVYSGNIDLEMLKCIQNMFEHSI